MIKYCDAEEQDFAHFKVKCLFFIGFGKLSSYNLLCLSSSHISDVVLLCVSGQNIHLNPQYICIISQFETLN